MIAFTVNGVRQLVDEGANITLLEFLRKQAHTTSAKASCTEGGCGACAVLIDGKSVNSCLLPVYAADGCSITTAEGLDSGIAERLAGFHASQCGFCTPGMAVACHAALSKASSQGKAPSATDMRNALDGNLCRCTGYRPIIDACKSFASGIDMEDLGLNTFATDKKPLPTVNVTAGGCCGAAKAAPVGKVVELGTKQKVHVPASLDELLKVLRDLSGSSMRVVAGSTGHGVLKDWPNQDNLVYIAKIPQLCSIEVIPLPTGTGQVIKIGAGITLSNLIDQLEQWSNSSSSSVKQSGTGPETAAAVWKEIAAHLRRVAGSHVRNSATVVGNLVLTRRAGLPSDVATLLLAAGASVEMIDTSASEPAPKVETLAEFVRPQQALNPEKEAALLVTAVHIPVPQAGSRFWSTRIAPRYANAVSTINVAAMLPLGTGNAQPRVVFGMDLEPSPAKHNWQLSHCTSVESVLSEYPSRLADAKPSLSTLLSQSLAGLPADLESCFKISANSAVSDARHQFLSSAAEGLLLQAVSALFETHKDPSSVLDSPSSMSGDLASNGAASDSSGSPPPSSSPATEAASLLPAKMSPPQIVKGKQDFPTPDPELAPLTQPIPKESALLQAKGLATYSDDVQVAHGALYAAWVTSTVAKGRVVSIDTSQALAVPGVVRFVGADDVPVNSPSPADEPVFAKDVEYHGQGIGLILADSYTAANQAAKLVKVEYAQPESPAVLSIDQALAAGSVYPLEYMIPTMFAGHMIMGAADVGEKIASSPHKLTGIKLSIPSTAHMYMEPQTSVAELDEGGCFKIHTSSQHQEHALAYVSAALGVKHNMVELTNKRLGGAFGGKVSPASHQAAAAAVAAMVTNRQVHLASNRNADLAMVGGRCEVEMLVDVGFDQDGHILAMDQKNYYLAGAYMAIAFVDILRAAHMPDAMYTIPSFHVSYSLLRANLPPRNSVRAPGDMMSVIGVESIIDLIAGQLGLDPTVVRERNLWKPTGDKVLNSLGVNQGAASQYSLPRIWKELKEGSDYENRLAHIKEFNAINVWRKRGIAMQPAYYAIMALQKSALVHIYGDGSVRVAVPGAEIGQGMYIKALQTAAYELSKLLPVEQRPLPLDLFKPLDHNSYILPHQGFTGGSTTTDAACAAVKMACEDLVTRLKPLADQLGDKITWQGLIASNFFMPNFPPMIQLSACIAGNQGSFALVEPPNHSYSYSTYGAVVSEVEIDVLTGDRRVLAVDLLFDCGKSLNPSVDLGQLEGAFMMGLGQALNEYVAHDPETGASLTNSTWSYKIPGAMCVPERFNAAVLRDSPLAHKGPLSAKAVGEPAQLLGVSVLSAIRCAIRAAAQDVYGIPVSEQPLITLPATPEHIKLAVGTQPLGKLLPQLLPTTA